MVGLLRVLGLGVEPFCASVWMCGECWSKTFSAWHGGIAIRESAKVVDQAQRRVLRGVDDLDFFIGDEAIDKPTYATKWPIRHGIIEDWDLMERFMEQVVFKYLRAEPEDHYFLMVGVLWHNPSSLQPRTLDSVDPPASTS
ncbi:actin-related protein 3C isoform X2 [Gorilla gorilla gorilla]|uniref:actin-related protein 3C isoform X2 n=1 Tax=Gorilla gorilla gorilla TaxID=9595 RepID=UPI0024463108|nr:actin-related protein 3C isoform X3 [Gorilla gorilla gorilla]XP_055248338.1 actin-related protein 3C isoform X3 [Gorilla gorilla gorilla]